MKAQIPMGDPKDFSSFVSSHQSLALSLPIQSQASIIPSLSALRDAERAIVPNLPAHGLAIQRTTDHLLEHIAPALNKASLSPNYYGFVTGGVTPAARVADSLVSFYDQNVQVHLPDETIATAVEDGALVLLLDLLRLDKETWSGRTFTTGATSSNILGLACAREYVINQAIKRPREGPNNSINEQFSESAGEHGWLQACRAANIENIQILTTLPHSSLKKASSILGLGRACVHDVGMEKNFLTFDLEKTEEMLRLSNTVSILVISCGEVNTGFFATHSFEEVQALRSLCDKYGAWMHVDAAFGAFARILNDLPEFDRICRGAEGLELANSITGDGHKLLNVPYDCGFFFCRHPNLVRQVFHNPNAAYLSAGVTAPGAIQSPLNIGIENSRRFRGLPVYATLISYGRTGYIEMLQRQIRLARNVAAYFLEHPALELLPESISRQADIERDIFIIVLFRAKDSDLNSSLVKRINQTSQIYVSGTMWEGLPASRIAVSNWQADPDRDTKIIQSVIEDILRDWTQNVP